MPLDLPAIETRTDVEQLWTDLEPPGLFPPDQDSWWGQRRKIYADYLQQIADGFVVWYLNMNPNTVDDSDISNWEEQLGIPLNVTGSTLEERRSFIVSRWSRGPFTHARRAQIVEAFITPTFGAAPQFSPGGIPFDDDGIPFHGDVDTLAGTYIIDEDIPNFRYSVIIAGGIDVDVVGLTRELGRITPSPITFDVGFSNPIPGLAPSGSLEPDGALSPS